MTTPTGDITLGDVAAELGIALPLTLGDPRVIALRGGGGLPIELGQLRGKSAFTVDFTIGAQENAPAGGTARRVTRLLTAVVTGTGPFTYAWTLDAATVRNGFYGGTNASTARLGQTYDLGEGEILEGEVSQVTLTVTDQGAGRTLAAVHAVDIH